MGEMNEDYATPEALSLGRDEIEELISIVEALKTLQFDNM